MTKSDTKSLAPGHVSETKLKVLADAVAEEHEELLASMRETREAEAELFQTVIHVVRVALPAMASRVKISEEGRFDTDGRYKAERSTMSEAPVVLISGELAGPSRNPPRAESGVYEGSDIFLDTGGELFECTYSGSWAVGGRAQWTSDWVVTTPEALIRGRRSLQNYVIRIATLLESQLGERANRVRQLTDESEGIRAVSSLLRLLKK